MAAHQSERTLVLGLGNDLLGDDAIGLRVAAAVSSRLTSSQNLLVLQSMESGLALLDLAVGFDRLLVIDAINTTDPKPGTLHELSLSELQQAPAIGPHFLGLAQVLALGQQLGLPVPRQVHIFAVEVQDCFTIGSELTAAMEAALPAIADRVMAVCRASLE